MWECTNCCIRVFVDHDPKYFSVILNYMREGRIRPSAVNSADYGDLIREFEFFNIPYPSWLQVSFFILTQFYYSLCFDNFILLYFDCTRLSRPQYIPRTINSM